MAPLVVWGFSECYARFASQPWALDDASLANELAHLCNFSVQKNAAIDDSGIPENMWDEKTLAAAVDSVFGIGAFREQLRPAFRGLGIAACRAAAASGMKKVARGFEWLGLDVLIADDLSCHLLEVNVSPDVSLSTVVTARLVPAATEDALTLVVDEGHASDAAVPVAACRVSAPAAGPPIWEFWLRDAESTAPAAPAAPPLRLLDAAADSWWTSELARYALAEEIQTPVESSSDEEL